MTETQPRTDAAVGGEEPAQHREIGRGTARLVSAAALRQVLNTGLLAVTAAVVARELGAGDFGAYAGGTAAFNLANSLTDLGFGMVLTREMAKHPNRVAQLMRSTVQVQLLWSVGLAALLLGVGAATGSIRGEVMMILSPAVAISGLSGWRQIFTVRYRAAPLLVVDIGCTVLQAGSMIGLAIAHAGVPSIALALLVAISLNVVLAVRLGRRELGDHPPVAYQRWQMFRLALPIGIASVLASLYFTVDLTILGWLVSSRELGQYAAAVRLLTALVAVPGFVMAAAMPGLAQFSSNRDDLSRFAARLAHWLAVTGLPLAVALGVFAHPVIHIVFGSGYDQSIGLLEILMVAGVLSLASNILGVVLVTANVVRVMVVFNVLSLALNVAGNLILVPAYGVSASAWLTGGCELLVVSYAVVALRPHLSFRPLVMAVSRPLTVTTLAAAAGLALGADDLLSIGASVVVFVVGTIVLRSWPSELVPGRIIARSPKRTAGGSE